MGLMTLTSCLPKYVPVYLDREGDWVLREDACAAMPVDPITVEQYRGNKDLRVHILKQDARWASYCIVNAKVPNG